MASKVEGEKFRDLICPMCLDVFKNATLLGCGHTFCKGCLQAYDEQHDLNYIVCPICRKNTQLGRERVAGLTPNYSVKGIEDEVRLEVKDSSPNVCSLHKAEYKTLFCEVCTEFICITCFIDKHQGHKIMKKEEFESELKKTRGALVQEGLLRKTEIEKSVGDAKKELAAMFCNLSTVENRIRNTCSRKRAMLQEDEDRLLKQVDDSRKELDKQLGCRIANNQELIDNIDRSIKGLMGSMTEQFDSIKLEAHQVKCSVLEYSLTETNDKLFNLEELLAVVKQRVERVQFFPADETLLALGRVEFGGKATSVADNVQQASVQSDIQQASVQSVVQQASVLGDVQQASVQGDVQQASLQGDVQQASLQGDFQQASVQGDFQQASVQGDVQQASVQGDVRQASVQGDVQQASVQGGIQQASVLGDVQQASVRGDVQQASVQGGIQQASVLGDVQQASVLGDVQQASVQSNVQQASVQGDVQQTSVQGDVQQTSVQGDVQQASVQGDVQQASNGASTNAGKRKKKKKNKKGKDSLTDVSSGIPPIIKSPLESMTVVRHIRLPNHMASMAAMSQDEVVVGYIGLGGSECFSLSGARRPYLENAKVHAIAFLTDGRIATAYGGNTCCVYQKDSGGAFKKGMEYKYEKGDRLELVSLCTDQHDNIYVVNGNRNIYIFHGNINCNPQKALYIEFSAKQIHMTKSGVIITTNFGVGPSSVLVFDRGGQWGPNPIFLQDGAFQFATVDSQDRVLVARMKDLEYEFGLTRYTLQGTKLVFERAFKDITIHQVDSCFFPSLCWTTLVSLTPTMLALAYEKQLFFIQLPE